MTDEEKKAIEKIKKILYMFPESEELKLLLNLTEKQTKEIEELKEDRDNLKKALGKRITYCNELEKDLFENCSNYVVSKDKIKAKIEYYEKIDNPVGKRVLQSLLEKE